MRLTSVICAGFGVLSLSGCAVAAVGAVTAVGYAAFQEKSIGTAMDDTTLASEIKFNLVSRGGYGEVDVEVASGLVLLSGRVRSEDMRRTAEHVAWKAKKTVDVANEIQVEGTRGVRGNASDEWITARVRTRIIASPKVRGINFNIETYNGIVYLMGIARSEEELLKAAEIASTTGGVREVVSYVEIRERARPPVVAEAPIEDIELEGGPQPLVPREAAGRAFENPNKVVKYDDIDDGEW